MMANDNRAWYEDSQDYAGQRSGNPAENQDNETGSKGGSISGENFNDQDKKEVEEIAAKKENA